MNRNIKIIKSLGNKTLLALYNDLTGKSTSKFASREKGEIQTVNAAMAAGEERVTKLLVNLGALTQEDVTPAAKAPKKDKAPKAAKAETETEEKPDVILAAAARPESTRPGLTTEIYEIVKAVGPAPREQLVETILEKVSPPRSKQFNRNYVLGYLAHGVRQGYLAVEE